MTTAYLLCGPSLSGKSTLADRIARHLGAIVCSADAINARRGLAFGGEGLDESVWAETLRLELEAVREAGAGGTSIVVDDTLCYRWLRDRLRAAALAGGLQTRLLLLRPPEAELLARRAEIARTGVRPLLSLPRLREHLASFEWPGADESPVDLTTPAQQDGWLRGEHAGG